MPNPYDDLFDNPLPDKKPESSGETPADPTPEPMFSFDGDFDPDGPDALDEILALNLDFNNRAEEFSRNLSKLRVVDHEVKGKVTRLFLVSNDPHRRGSLAGEKQYHQLQTEKFFAIIEPMRELAELHMTIVKQFNRDIDEHYFSVEKTKGRIESEKTLAMDNINLQRKILAEAADALKILRGGLIDTERRLKEYVNAGGKNNISSSEFELLVRKREQLTTGLDHQFDYRIFDTNLLDKTALSLGIYMKETSAQYLARLGKAFQ
ncbi:hypothetical protein FUA23_18130 [Neolewinella aurantiaca]|uniref:Uncharacterized protein n=1 Tax=Neolewinella aurantiaca TaxID=2602767 RepID=A0A5C7FNN1_9BACT|nr:hypothetical protein [Neolewinella aurantiaca]TXF87619.1 hypothetical protein FUA23_18130 [Neolewinella aurantiaca]